MKVSAALGLREANGVGGRAGRPHPSCPEVAAGRGAIAGIQRDGTCWLGGTEWRGRHAARISFSNWSTSDEDIDRSADANAHVRIRDPRRPG